MTDESSPELRASHADRDRVVEQLRIAAGDGRLTLDELDERLEKALAARTAGELVELVNDLPLSGPPAPKDLVQIDVQAATSRREGRWVVPRVLEVTVDSGSVVLDLSTAVITNPTLRIKATVTSGSLRLVTRPGIEVDADQVKVRSGSVQVRTPPGGDPATFLRVEVAGSVDSGSIVARPPRRSLLAWLLRRPPGYGTIGPGV
ncbi:DUF1707 SHOCT-like domain-containing protein [Actinomadura rudentiformis]|uniref:DUF1707 domain-containing protein n=1 Tax=Actinomadura rudentiformis TaxID=359158 RepID=A0A6H9YQB6_9ACTN|nr:DUF1707 domain-containing protein [Actinomadura rudentiformis]KAB2345083.1 DUF1707 domain-containing protein [Actinomadura rudentiformis]